MSNRMQVQINAWEPSGKLARGDLDLGQRAAKRFALNSAGEPPGALLAPGVKADLADWKHADVGWGLVAATSRTLPAAIKNLVSFRGGQVFRYQGESERRFTFLCNEALNRDVAVAGSPIGNGPGRLPYYLMILGGPDEVPWALQFALASTRAVGRLPLAGTELANHVRALLDDFKGGGADPYTTVTWSVDLGVEDITHLMRKFLAEKIHAEFVADPEMGATRSINLGGDVDGLVAALKEQHPGVIVTTSHGMTGPLDDVAAMRAQMGAPVDRHGKALTPALLDGWAPAGAVWYCHACCSAGAEAPSVFAPLFDEGTGLRLILEGISAAGAMVAPLPLALLGHAKPARAFIGHVEPTFDWTLRNPVNQQVVTKPIVDAIYPNLFQRFPRTPIGHAFRQVYANIGSYLANWQVARQGFDSGASNLPELMNLQLSARDLQGMVILGDPAVTLPLRPGAG